MNKKTVGNNKIDTSDGRGKSNRINTRLLITASIALSMFLVLAGTVSADNGFPTMMNRFSGDVTLDDDPAPVGTVINAYIGGELRGSVTVETAGKYVWLGVNGSSMDNGSTITFTVSGVDADQTEVWIEGSGPRSLDLTTAGLCGDTNGDGTVDMGELFAAIDAYIADPVDMGALFCVIDAYIATA
ncbi:MAG: hypothetical protein KAU52_05850 [Methanosarcinales archaeon]|nr:hypothetical protein [Methanosarcinales archaeon]